MKMKIKSLIHCTQRAHDVCRQIQSHTINETSNVKIVFDHYTYLTSRDNVDEIEKCKRENNFKCVRDYEKYAFKNETHDNETRIARMQYYSTLRQCNKQLQYAIDIFDAFKSIDVKNIATYSTIANLIDDICVACHVVLCVCERLRRALYDLNNAFIFARVDKRHNARRHVEHQMFCIYNASIKQTTHYASTLLFNVETFVDQHNDDCDDNDMIICDENKRIERVTFACYEMFNNK